MMYAFRGRAIKHVPVSRLKSLLVKYGSAHTKAATQDTSWGDAQDESGKPKITGAPAHRVTEFREKVAGMSGVGRGGGGETQDPQ